jgi:hypothetical protein
VVTHEFLASDFIHEHELGPLLKEAQQGGVRILWVPVRDSPYKKTALQDYQAVLDPEKALAKMKGAERAQAWVRICEEIEKAVKLSSPEHEPGADVHKAALSNLPDRNPFFTGRNKVLAQLAETLAQRGRAALSGLGGVGKTQTAVEYAHRHLDEYEHVFLATAASREALVSGYTTTAGLLGLLLAEVEDQTPAVNGVKRWLSSHQRWLLILDNTDDLTMICPFIPPGKNGHLLVTGDEEGQVN